LVRRESVGAPQYEIPRGAAVLNDLAGNCVLEAPELVGHTQANRRRSAIAFAGTVVDAARRKVAAGTGAGKRVARTNQPLYGRTVKRMPILLKHHRLVGLHAEHLQRFQYLAAGACALPRRIDILDTHQPVAAKCTSTQPATERSNQRAEVQASGRRGRKSTSVACD